MFVKESNACFSWCPFSRVRSCVSRDREESEREPALDDAHVATSSFNRAADIEEPYDVTGTECVGAHCMAWRRKEGEDASDEDALGYCGLAGRPS